MANPMVNTWGRDMFPLCVLKLSRSRRNLIRRAAMFGVLAALNSLAMPAVADTAVVGMLPKFTSDPYFVAANKGAQQAASELGITVEFNGPVDASVAAQTDIIDRWIRRRVSAIAVSANDPNALAPAMRRAAAAGIKVMTWDADVLQDARAVFLNQASFAAIGKTLVDMMARTAGTTRGNFLIITAVLTAPNQNRWIDELRKYAAEAYPGMRIAAVLSGDDDLEKSKNVTLNYLQANPDTKGVFSVTGIATPGIVEAIKELGLVGKVAVAGLGVPSLIRPYLKDGSLREATLWNPVDIGYAAIYIVNAQLKNTLNPRSGYVDAGRLGKLKFISNDTVLLGEPLIFSKNNIDQFNF
jgi:rhamnose transport system substrate-binding protein